MQPKKPSFLSSSIRHALYGTTALMATIGAQNAVAQTANENPEDDPEIQEIIEVTGIKGALRSAAEIKRESDTFVDSITASDATALPDLSVAEALSRIPGLTISRFDTGGISPDFPTPEGSGNLIRGLGFIRSEFNGRDAFSANGGRALDWSAIPPQLIGGVDVYKNQSADLIEGGIGGTINLRTLEPFDSEDSLAVIAVDGIYADLREEWSPTVSGVFGKNFESDKGKFGFVGSFSSSELQSFINGYQVGQLNPRDITTANLADPSSASDPIGTIAAPQGFQLRTNEFDRDRDSYYGAVQWQSPDESIEVLVKYVRVENEVTALERTTEAFPGAGNFENFELSDVVIAPFTSGGIPRCNGNGEDPPGDCDRTVPITGGIMEEGLITDNSNNWYGAYGLELSNLAIGKVDESQTDDISLNVKWQMNESWFVEFDAHRTTAEATYREQWIGSNTFVQAFTRPDLDNPVLRVDIDPRNNWNPNNIVDGGNVQSPFETPTNTADPGGYFLPFASDGFRDGDGDLTAVKADFQYDFDSNDWFESVKFGARYSEREQINQEAELLWRGVSQAWIGGGLTPLDAFDTEVHQVVDFSDFFRGGVVQGDNQSFVYIDERFLRNPDEFYDFLFNEPDIQSISNGQYNPLTNGNGTVRRVRLDDGTYQEVYQPGDISNISEETINLYVMLKFGHDFSNGMWLDGNIGVRYVENTTNSAGFLRYSDIDVDIDDTVDENGNPDPTYPQSAEDRDHPEDFTPEAVAFSRQADVDLGSDQKEDFWLPSLNLKLNLNDEMLVRFGASKAITRPNIADLRAARVLDVRQSRVEFDPLPEDDPNFGIARGVQDIATQRLVINGGNPALEAIEAINIDLSYEWYFNNGGFFTVGYFWKDIENVIQQGVQTEGSITLDGTPLQIQYSGNINVAEADLSGVEIAYQNFFDDLPGIWKYFGVQANYTYIDASATPPPPFIDADADGEPDAGAFLQTLRWNVDDLLGQSEHIANLIGIYQDDDLEVRLAYNWRSEYLVSYRDFLTGNPIYQKAAGFLDASVRYDLTENINVSFLVANILDTKSKSESQIDAENQRYQRSSFLNDRRFQFGVTYKF